MSKKGRNVFVPEPSRWYRGADIPKSVIRAYARKVAERFQPDKIILFGSHAYGQPHEDSDVDLLVIMPARNELDQAFKIRLEVPAPFPMDLLVRTPKEMKWRLEEGESFLTEITSKGQVLYEKSTGEWMREAGADLGACIRSNRPLLTIELSLATVLVKIDDETIDLGWGALGYFYETPKLIVLRVPGDSFAIPKRVCGSDDILLLLRLLKKKLPTRPPSWRWYLDR